MWTIVESAGSRVDPLLKSVRAGTVCGFRRAQWPRLSCRGRNWQRWSRLRNSEPHRDQNRKKKNETEGEQCARNPLSLSSSTSFVAPMPRTAYNDRTPRRSCTSCSYRAPRMAYSGRILHQSCTSTGGRDATVPMNARTPTAVSNARCLGKSFIRVSSFSPLVTAAGRRWFDADQPVPPPREIALGARRKLKQSSLSPS